MIKIKNPALRVVAVFAVALSFAGANVLAQAIPPAPSNLRVSGTISGNSIPLAWDASAGADKYNIDRKLTTDSNWNAPVFVAQVMGATSYTDTTVSSGMSYDYRFQACLSGTGCSDYAYLIGIATSGGGGGDATSPSMPTGLYASGYSSSQINLSWTASTDNTSVTGYKIFRNSAYLTTVTSPYYSDTGLSPGTTYGYFVKAVDAAMNESSPSAGAYGTTLSSLPTTPSGLAGTVSGANIYLTWTDNSNNETRFELYRSIVSGTWSYIGQVGSGVTTYNNSNLSPGTYTYQILACNGLTVNTGCSGGSNITPGLTVASGGGSPTPPTISAPSSSGVPVNVYWSGGSGATYYNLYHRNPPGSGGWIYASNGAGTASNLTGTSFSDTSVAAGLSYEYKVNACNTYGCVESNYGTVSVSGGGSAPSTAPSLTATSPAPAPVSLYWGSVSGAIYYTLSRQQQGYSWVSGFATTSGISYYDYWPSGGYTINYKVSACNSYGCSPDSNIVPVSVTSGGGSCTGLNLNFANNKTSYTQGETVNYTYACTPGGIANSVTVQVVNPSGAATTYNSGTNVSTMSLGFGTSNLSPGNYTLRACFTSNCSPVTVSASFAVTSPDTQSTTPSAPTGLAVTGIASNYVNLAWNAVTDATYYKVWRSPGTWINVWSTTWTDTSVTAGVTYTYFVTAVRTVSPYDYQSASSTSIQVSVPAGGTGGGGGDATSPSMPTGLYASGYSSSQINLSWTASTDNTSVTGYKIFRNSTYITTVTGTSYSSTGLTAGTTYSYFVKAADAAMNESSPSANAYGTTLSGGGTSTSSTPAAPTNLRGSVSGSNVTLYWNDNSTNESGFKLYRGPSWTDIGNVGPNIAYYADVGLAPGTYTYHLNAFNSSGISPVYSAVSNDITIVVGAPNVATATTVGMPGVSIFADGTRGSVSRVGPASYTLSWNVAGDSVSCVKSGTWGGTGASVPSGSQYFTGVSVLGSKTYTLTCSNSAGSSSDTVTVNIVSSPPIGATSTAQSASGFLQGFVSDADGAPAGNVYVHVFPADFSLNFNAITNINGSFGISIPAGTYFVEIYPSSARPELVRPAQKSVSVASGAIQTVSLQFGAASKTITGAVTFSDGNPVTDAEVGAYSNLTQQWVSASTDANGNFVLSVSGGTWQVAIRPKNPGTALWASPGQPQQAVFANDSSAETKTVNFSILARGAQVNVHTTDQDGNPVQGAGVVMDTMSAGQQGTQGSQPVFKKSDAGGTATFPVQGGTYYLRAFLPTESGFLNPDEQVLALNSADVKDVFIVFRKRATAPAVVILEGVTKFDDGMPTDAYVWAWSEKGGAAQIHSDASGNWKTQVSPGRWHIGAGKERNGIPYKSSDLTVDVDMVTLPVEIIMSNAGLVLPPPVTVSQSATEQIVAQAKDGARVELPAGSAASSGNVNLEVKPTIEAASQAGAKVVGTAYDVNITNASGGNITSLQKDIEITIPYSESDLTAQNITADKLIPSYYDTTTGAWVKVDNYTLDKVNHVVIIRVGHLTRFALVAAADITPPVAPTAVAVVSTGLGELSLAWINPKEDFDHAKVYRSTTAETLGTIIANSVGGGETKDISVADGTKYYYTVRAIDAAGNESVNIAQVSAVAKGTSAGAVSGKKITQSLKMGSRGDAVLALQRLLLQEGVYPEGVISGYFGKLTFAAVIRFQEKYFNEILKPNGLDKGTGFVGVSTLAMLNKLIK